ncbi:MAG: M24 family metallopeptidase, partial [Planctomycetota bacterium]
PHATPGTQTLDDNPVLLIDWGANLHGYTSDLTRTLHRDGADPQFESAYQAVLDGQMAAIRMMGPGVKLSDVDAAARDVIDSAGYGDAFSHGLGHGIGLQVHESPRMAGTSEGTLQAGMVVTVEPGVYFAGRFGIRIEDDVLITQDGCESLSNLPKTLADSHYQL